MKKNNQKGFMLVEAFITSTIVLGVLVFMFLQLRTIVNGFDKSFSYNTIPGIYIANELGNFIKNYDYENIKADVDVEGYLIKGENSYNYLGLDEGSVWNEMLESSNIKTVIISDENVSDLKQVTDVQISDKLKSYISSIKVDNLSGIYRIIVEFKDGTFASVKIS